MRKNLLCLFLLIIFFAFNSLSSSVYAAPDPANLKRFGVGWGYLGNKYDIYMPVVFDLGVGWITNWRYNWIPPKTLKALTSAGLDNMPLVMKERGDQFSTKNCQDLKNYVAKYPDSFPVNKTFWSVGNELGYDINLTASQYASEFVNWRDCIKSINSNYKVGSGAIISLWSATPRTYPSTCVSYEAKNSGATFLKTYIKTIKAENSAKLPDFMVMHAYPSCTPPLPDDSSILSKFKNHILSHRKLMKELGLQNKELWIKEYPGRGTTGSFVTDSINYLLTAKDSSLGYPGDDHRLVQRFAWFQLKNTTGGSNSTPALANDQGQLNIYGQAYRNSSRAFAGAPLKPPAPSASVTPSPTPNPTPTPHKGDANNDRIVNRDDFTIWKNNYAKTAPAWPQGASQANFNEDTVVDGQDYAIWFGNFGT